MRIGLDLDGTILNYENHNSEIRRNTGLVRLLPPKASIAIISNQGGVVLGKISAVQVANRLDVAIAFLRRNGYRTAHIYLSAYHPRADQHAIERAARQLRTAVSEMTNAYTVFATEKSRKPSPYMLKVARVAAYCGDSPEDAEAAKAAQVPFIYVERYR